ARVRATSVGRAGRGPVRAAILAGSGGELGDVLGALGQGGQDPRVVTGDRDLVGRGPVWVFSGYGSQWTGMGRQLLLEEPAFAAAVGKLDAQVADVFDFSLQEHLASAGDLDRLDVAQPVLFGVQLALAEMWRSYGVEPVAVIGHSLGEVAAAVCAGALDVADAARIVAVRARLLGRLQGGAMAVVDLEDGELATLERDFPGVQVAVHTSPRQKVVTGDEMAVARLVRGLEERGRAARAMRVVGAGHSPQVDPLLPELVEALADVRGRSPRIPVYSTVLDEPRGASEFDAEYWAANLRRPVRLDRALAAAAADGHTAFMEISPHPVLTRAVADNVPGALTVGTLRRDAAGSAAFLAELGTLYAAGLDLPLPSGRVIDLPAPRWRHVRYWWTDGRTPVAATATQGWAEPTPAPVPEDPVATRVSHHIATVTGHPAARITSTTTLTDLGLDSLMAVRIRTALEGDFGVTLHLRELFEATTVAELADRVGRLINSAHPPLFLFHAAGGTTDVYHALAQHLGADRPVHGLDRIDDARTVSEKARRYAEEIIAACPNGPYLLAGWSFGGFVAQETARQLTASGREVALVVLIDAVRPLPRPDRVRTHLTGFARHIADTFGVQLALPYDELVAMDDDRERIDLVLRILREAVQVPSAALEHQRASYLDLRIGEAHRPGRYDGRVVLYRATEPAPHTVRDPAYERDDDGLGWDEVCSRLTVVPVAGHHLSLLDPPYVDEIAAHLRRVLASPGGPAEPD
ncbi:acyltransferase domain-containing protein, partial [Streptomyces sp. MBT65]|uniref:acyltransferase domain-containing protein n=1 Tax=Streptomyces sp. MBT65 TaxID=1488395 RepID=UPI00190B84D6